MFFILFFRKFNTGKNILSHLDRHGKYYLVGKKSKFTVSIACLVFTHIFNCKITSFLEILKISFDISQIVSWPWFFSRTKCLFIFCFFSFTRKKVRLVKTNVRKSERKLLCLGFIQIFRLVSLIAWFKFKQTFFIISA